MKRLLLTTCAIGCLLPAAWAPGAEDILIADFEGKTYGQWKATGKAFGTGPASGKIGGQKPVSGYKGKGLVNTFCPNDRTVGTLTSPPITVQRKYIAFLIGGGHHPGKTCINLLADGKIVHSATGLSRTGSDTETLIPECFDVSKLMGKKVVLQIVDQHTGGWGHINIDHIVQTDTKTKPRPKIAPRRGGRPTGKTFEKTLTPTKKYLLFPVNDRGPRARVILKPEVGEELQFTMGLGDKQNVDFWGSVLLAPYGRKPIKLTVAGGTQEGFDSIVQADEVPYAKNLYDEELRPQFHFSQRVGWNNDPNGMCYANGEYHLFFQHNPFGWKWGNMTWGHAVSKDLVHWTQLENALLFDKLGTMFSGSGAVDKANTAGFKTGKMDVIVLAYTYAGRFGYPQCPFTQAIAYSNDNGRTFVKYKGNPVVKNISGGSDRDPKIIWHEPTKKWVMVLYLANGRKLGVLTSDNLKQWKLVSELKGFHECPELFELPVEPVTSEGSAGPGADRKNNRWVIFGADGQYFIGSFDGKVFKPEHPGKYRVHYGRYYASQTFNQTPDGRRIQIGWARIPMNGMPFNQTFTFPHRLTLRKTADGVRMFARPVREIALLHKARHTTKPQDLAEGKPAKVKASGRLFDIRATFKVGQAKSVGIDIGGQKIAWSGGKLFGAPLAPVDGKISMQLLVDRPMIEVCGNDGRVYITQTFKSQDVEAIEAFCTGQGAALERLEVYELKSIWKK